jgi:1-phosphofructokinase
MLEMSPGQRPLIHHERIRRDERGLRRTHSWNAEACRPETHGESACSHLLQDEQLRLRAVPVGAASGAYVHDRRSDQRHEWWRAPLGPLGRHEVDELYTDTLAAALERGMCMLTGTHRQGSVLPDSTYTRLASDLRANEVSVLCDLQGDPLCAALEGGIDLVKISHDELVEDGWATGDEVAEIVEGMRRLCHAGTREVVVSRAKGGALALLDGVVLEAPRPK